MNNETDVATSIASSIKRAYGFRGEFDDLVVQVTHAVAEVRVGGVHRIPALDDLVGYAREQSGRAKRADINAVTGTIFSLFDASLEEKKEAV